MYDVLDRDSAGCAPDKPSTGGTTERLYSYRRVDELLVRLNANSNRGGTVVVDTKVRALAFADDIVVLEDRDIDMVFAIGEAVTFFAVQGMEVNPKKCVAISAGVVKGKSIPRTRLVFQIAGKYIQSCPEIPVSAIWG